MSIALYWGLWTACLKSLIAFLIEVGPGDFGTERLAFEIGCGHGGMALKGTIGERGGAQLYKTNTD